MFFHLLQALGAFLGGLGAFFTGTAQLLAFLRRKDEERAVGHREGDSGSWMIRPGLVQPLSAAA